MDPKLDHEAQFDGYPDGSDDFHTYTGRRAPKRLALEDADYDRMDILDAHYWFCADYHDGQWSRLYERLCRIGRVYQPSPLAHGPGTDNAKSIYANLERAARNLRLQGG